MVHAYASDITERLDLENQLRQSQKMEAIGQLAAGVAHDFNNILTVIQGHVSLLLRKNPHTPMASSLEQVSTASERAAGLTRQLLMFSRKQVMQAKTVNLNEIVNNLAMMLHRLIGEDICLLFLYGPDLPAIEADPGMMEQVILNLVVNARDAMPKGGQLTITTSLAQLDEARAQLRPDVSPGRYVCLVVTDTGCGMDEATLERIFEPFFTTKEVGKGTGLGLATVYGIVKQHQGWIDVSSQPGKGSTFNIYFPCSAKSAPEPIESPASDEVHRGQERILFVEDESLVRKLGLLILAEFGYRVVAAADGKDALKVWDEEKGQVDLLVTDLVMPNGMSGQELAEVLKTRKPGLKVIYTSGYSADILGRDFSQAEKVDFLQKPYKPQTLAEAVRQCLDR